MKTYLGSVTNMDWEVFVVEGDRPYKLNPGYEHVNHSPDGFAWGYGGSGPAQLAFALLLDATQNVERSLKLYQDFKWAFIARLPQDKNFHISVVTVLAIARQIEEKYEQR